MDDIQKTMYDLYKSIEVARQKIWEMSNILLKPEEINEMLGVNNQWSASYDDAILKIYIPDYPPKMQIIRSDDKTRDIWTHGVMNAILSLKEIPRFDKAFIWIQVYLPLKSNPWDVDNRQYHYIINGIHFAGIISDDVYSKMSFGVDGFVSDTPHTEVYITERENADLLLQKLTKMENKKS